MAEAPADAIWRRVARNVLRHALNVLATLVIAIEIARGLNSITFNDTATDILCRAAGYFGQYGDETIEDFYLDCTITIGLVVAIGLVVVANRAVGHRRARRMA